MLLTLNLIIKTYYLHHSIVLMMTETKVIGLCVDFGGTTIILLTKLASLMISSTHFKLSVRTWISNYKNFVLNLHTKMMTINFYIFLIIYLNSLTLKFMLFTCKYGFCMYQIQTKFNHINAFNGNV